MARTDMQARLDIVARIAEKAKMFATTERVPRMDCEDEKSAIASLAYCVEYLAEIVKKHLRTGEV